MSNYLRLFYADKLVMWQQLDPFPTNTVISSILRKQDIREELYNGGYVQLQTNNFAVRSGWYRCDMTPVLDEDVPKTLKLLVLLLD